MLTILYRIISLVLHHREIELIKGMRVKRMILELIVYGILLVSYVGWVVYIILSGSFSSMDALIAFLAAQEAGLSGSIALVDKAIHRISGKKKNSNERIRN